MSATSTPKQYQQQRRRIHQNNVHQSRNTNAYIDRDEYQRRALINHHHHHQYWHDDYHRSNDEFYLNEYYQHRNRYPLSSQYIRKGRPINKSSFSSSASNNNHAYCDNIPPRHRHQQQQMSKRESRSSHLQESKTNTKLDPNKSSTTNDEQLTKPIRSASTSSTNSDATNNAGLTNRKELHAKNLAAAAIAARQQNLQPQTNLSVVQTLMNSLILQQQQQPAQSQSTVQLQYQLTNALLATMIQQRLKESVLQAQAQQIQAALPTLLAAQALAYQQQQQQQGQLTANQQSILPPNVAHPGTKFNNRPLVKFPVVRPTLPTGTNAQATCSTTTLPTYQQVQEIERGISLDEAIHLKNAIDIADINHSSIPIEIETTPRNNSDIIE